MKIKNLLFLSLLLALMAGNAKAQDPEQPEVPQSPNQNFEYGMGDWVFLNGEGTPLGVTISDLTNTTENGQYSFQVSNPQVDCYLVSPSLDGTTGFIVTFMYTNYYEGAASFRVGYTDSSIDEYFDPELFEWKTVIADQGTMNIDCRGECQEGWSDYPYELPAGAKRFAIAFPAHMLNLFLDDFVFTEVECPKPDVPVIEEGKNSLTLTLTDEGDYVLWYKAGYNIAFEDDLEGWTSIDAKGKGLEWQWDDTDEGHGDDTFVYSSSFVGPLTDQQLLKNDLDLYLVSPLVQLGGSIMFWARSHDENAYEYERFGVAVSVDGNTKASDFVNIVELTVTGDWMMYTVDLSNYSGKMGYVAIRHYYVDFDDPDEDLYLSGIDIDDITIFTSNWIEEAITDSPYILDGLMHETTYALQLRSVCDDNKYSSWTDMVIATTDAAEFRFVKNGVWNNANNWKGGAVPEEDNDDVTIAANAIIPTGCVATAGNVIVKFGNTITIEDGGQLKHNNEGVVATMEKNITPYSDSEGKDHYYLFGLPVLSSLHPSQVANMMTEDDDFQYDIYYFDESEEQEWKNIKAATSQDNFWFNRTKGFLYARDGEDPITLSATGELNPSNGDGSALLYYTNNEGVFAGWNLIANPFPCNASLENDRAFYRLEEVYGESKIVPATDNVIAPMEGIFVQTTNTEGESVTFIPVEETEQSGMGSMNFSLRKAFMRSEVNLDRSLIRFGEGHNMGHLDLMADPNRLYIPLDGKAMSVVYSQPVGELPLNLEAADDGTFVLGFANNAEDLAYCHLIDNMTGADIDLLKYPEYTFEAKSDDYASRFRVVFVAKDAEGIAEDSETFAFNSYGSWIIVNEGLATLQMVDINGRMICNETIEGYTSMKFNVAPGVYVLRLVNGENVRVQKVVVR